MYTEYEIRILNINREEIIEKIKKLGAKFISDEIQKISAFYAKDENDDYDFIRIRNENSKIALTHKITKDKSYEAKEWEIYVNSYQDAFNFIESLGYKKKLYSNNSI